jgi:hypothetical protein
LSRQVAVATRGSSPIACDRTPCEARRSIGKLDEDLASAEAMNVLYDALAQLSLRVDATIRGIQDRVSCIPLLAGVMPRAMESAGI